jgi:CRISPR/Cas system-associated exonuclease Cas4 (RecB family)
MAIAISLGAVLTVLALLLWLWGGWLRASTGVPGGVVVFSDTGFERVPGFAMVSKRFGLSGMPDFLIKTAVDGMVPVELKSGLLPRGGPYWNHVVQLVVYLLLVEEYYGKVSYGVIKYRDQSVKVVFRPELRKKVLALVSELRQLRRVEVEAVKRSHTMAGRCSGCAFRPVCDEALLM